MLIPLSNKIQRLYHPKKSREKVISGTLTGRQTALSSQKQRNSSALSKRVSANRITLNISNELEIKGGSDMKYRR